MSICGEKAFKFGKLCISNDDYLIILLNIIITVAVLSIFYIRQFSDKSSELSVTVKNNFTLLGEGELSNFYFPMASQQKSSNPKKKVQSKSPQQAASTEKLLTNNELKCNTCGRSVEVSYQYTIHKLNANTSIS